MTKIIGTYQVATLATQGRQKANSLCFENPQTGLRLYLNQRKEETPTKPLYFLLMQTEQGKAAYLSSLYPSINSANTYLIDDKKALYRVNLDLDSGTLSISHHTAPKFAPSLMPVQPC